MRKHSTYDDESAVNFDAQCRDLKASIVPPLERSLPAPSMQNKGAFNFESFWPKAKINEENEEEKELKKSSKNLS